MLRNMLYKKLLLILCYVQLSTCSLKNFIEAENLDDILMEEERNSRCCAQHMTCCKNASETTSFEIRALLVKCAAKHESCCDQSAAGYPQSSKKVLLKPEGQCDLKSYPQEVTACDRKLKLTIKIKNVGTTNTKNQYIIIDHVFDPLTEKMQKLLNPYVLKVKQEPILQTYGLSFENMVNSEAKEKVINKNDEGYTGCSTDPSQNPTCGAMKYEDEVIPYSTGFCCSCNNNERTGMNNAGGNFTGVGNSNNPRRKRTKNIHTFDLPEYNKPNDDHYGFISGAAGIEKETAAINSHNFRRSRSESDLRLAPFLTENEHIIQKRGGQDCSDRTTPPNVNPNTYHDSSHCLEFSDLWYSVYCIQEPKLFHSLQFQLYEKCQDQEGNLKWSDLGKSTPVTMGTENRFYASEDTTIIANYMARSVNPSMFSINYKIKKLLIPDASKIVYNDSYPELKGGPAQYLVVNENQIQASGKSCNCAGVGYEAFYKQPHRCSKPKGTCLQNQPKHWWMHDNEAEQQGKKGSYFLKHYGTLAENPIQSSENAQNKTLRLLYTQSYTSILDLEIKADVNVIMRPNSLAIITEVYVDSSSSKHTSILVKVFNSGLVSSTFFVGLTHCPLDLPASFNNIVSKPALIPPQQQHVYNMKIECPLPVNSFFCAVEVLNSKEELIAFRKIRLEKLDRCICIWHCLCACLLADKKLKCKPMTLEHYHAAGFQGSLPVPLHVVHYTFWDDLISLILYILLFLCLTLLIMGITKAIIGLFMVTVGLWGLDVILDLPKRMNNYYESDLRHRKVVYDENGWPVHPDTRERVRNIALPAEFSINIVFFFIYPFALFWTIIKKLCFSSYPKNYDDYDVCTCRDGTLVQKRSSSLQISLTKKASVERGKEEVKEEIVKQEPIKEEKPVAKEEVEEEESSTESL